MKIGVDGKVAFKLGNTSDNLDWIDRPRGEYRRVTLIRNDDEMALMLNLKVCWPSFCLSMLPI